MEFWKIAYDYNWVTKDELKGVVITEQNPFGDITKEQYEEITGEKY